MKVGFAVFILSCSFVSSTSAQECAGGPPSRTSDGYWTYLDACGCEKADAPSRASSDYDRYLKVCSAWRERNQGRIVLSPSLTVKECEKTPPSRTSSSYWPFLEACGCEKADAPSRTSSDYDRYLKTCSAWRERNPTSASSPRPSPKP